MILDAICGLMAWYSTLLAFWPLNKNGICWIQTFVDQRSGLPSCSNRFKRIIYRSGQTSYKVTRNFHLDFQVVLLILGDHGWTTQILGVIFFLSWDSMLGRGGKFPSSKPRGVNALGKRFHDQILEYTWCKCGDSVTPRHPMYGCFVTCIWLISMVNVGIDIPYPLRVWSFSTPTRWPQAVINGVIYNPNK